MIVQDDPINFSELYRRYAREVYRFALYLSADHAAAEDITSETFVRAIASPAPVRAQTAKSYLFQIARNLYLDHARRSARQGKMPEEVVSAAAGAEMSMEQKQRLARTLTVLREMPEIDRSALLMRAEDDMSYEEIARALGLSLPSAKVKVHRARLKLTEALAAQEKNV